MRSNEELRALVLDAGGWHNGLALVLIAIEADSPTNAANRAKEKGLTEPAVKRTRDLRIALDRDLYTPHALLHEFFNNEQNYQQGRHEMPTKTKILRTLAEIWIERDDPIKRSAAKNFLKTGFDPYQIEKHLGIQFKWDGSSPPPLDKDLDWGYYFLQTGIFHLMFSTSGKDEETKSTRLILTFDPFTKDYGLTLRIKVLPGIVVGERERQDFSLYSAQVISTVLRSSMSNPIYGKKNIIFTVRGVGGTWATNHHFEIDIGKNENDFDIQVRLLGEGGGTGSMHYRYRGLLPVKP